MVQVPNLSSYDNFTVKKVLTGHLSCISVTFKPVRKKHLLLFG